MNLASLNSIIPILYCALFGAYLFIFVQNLESAKFARVAKYATLTVHLTYFVLYGLSVGYMPLAGKAEFLFLTALALMVVYASIEKRLKQIKTGVFFTGIAFVLATVGSVYPRNETHSVLLENPTFGVHVLFMLLGFVSLAVGAIYAFMYLLFERQLKKRELGLFFRRLPALAELGRMSRIATTAGAILLAIGMALGYLLAFTLDEFDLGDNKLMISNIVLGGYFMGFLALKFRLFSEVKLAVATVAWFVVLVFSVGLASHTFG